VTFQSKSVVKDSSGQDVHTWGDAASPALIRSASIKPIKGREFVEARAVGSEVLISIMVRYDPEVALIDHDDRIIRTDDPTRIYAIHAVINHEERDRWLEFWCSEGKQDQF